ncbi:MAG TPA: succinate dehydrogenase flavoprotein subunit [Haliangiales bacterium]|nr:succinate dehydrogenase flavoprotein subunit [Haliangiales bacterium]
MRFVVVGGGLAGLAAVIKLAEAGRYVDVFSFVPCRRSHSVCAQGGINGAVNTKGEGDSPWEHFDDTVYGGDFLANQPPVKAMCDAAPGIIYLLDRMGVPFNRTSEGLIDFRRFGGTKHHRTAFAGATTGQQLLYALDEQVRRFESEGKVRRFEYWEFVELILDDNGRCRGIVAMDLHQMRLVAFPAAAVILATGGPGIIFGKSTNSVVNTGTAAAVAYQQGAIYANGEFIQVHPTSIPGPDKLRLMSESLRGEGGRLWVPSDGGYDDKAKKQRPPQGQPWYFLEDRYPAYGNLVPRDIATREIFNVCRELKLGVDGKDQVYLDLTHLGRATLEEKLKGVVEIYEKFVGDDPAKVPMRVFPGMHYSMGGLWIDYDHMTNVPGLFAAGEVDYQYHGANRLGANSLVSCIFGGFVAGPAAVRWGNAHPDDPPSPVIDAAQKQAEELYFGKLAKMDGPENPYQIAHELGDWMTGNCTVIRWNDKLRQTEEKVVELMDRWKNASVLDDSRTANRALMFLRQCWNMLVLARVIVRGALLRDESRGAHFKPDFPRRDDKNFLKTTRARYDAATTEPKIDYEPVDTSLIPPRERKYDTEKRTAVHTK